MRRRLSPLVLGILVDLVTINGYQLNVRIWEKGSGLRGWYEVEMERWRTDREQPFRPPGAAMPGR